MQIQNTIITTQNLREQIRADNVPSIWTGGHAVRHEKGPLSVAEQEVADQSSEDSVILCLDSLKLQMYKDVLAPLVVTSTENKDLHCRHNIMMSKGVFRKP